MNALAKLQNAINAIEEEVRAKSIARYEAVQNAWSEANENKDPVVDSQGRMHAPCDGYRIPCSGSDFNIDYSDTIFAGGQYLPIPLSDEDIYFGGRLSTANYPEHRYTDKVRVTAEDKAELEQIASHFVGVGFGRSWVQAGVEVCYAYLKSNHKNVFTLIGDYLTAKAEAAEAAIRANKGTAPEGKQTIEGTIMFTKDEVSHYGYRETLTTKAKIELDNGATIWGTLPAKISEAKQGQRVTFTATFNQPEGDTTHAFYKRPTKAAILN